jgi:hypothetical protein
VRLCVPAWPSFACRLKACIFYCMGKHCT